MSGRGRFISLEGIEGVGKSTLLPAVEDFLAERGREVLLTREPGGTPLAEALRELLLAERDETVRPLTEVLMLFAGRAQHVEEVIRPALEAGRWVVCDRFTDSTFAYQVGGRRADAAVVARLAEAVHADCWPDLTIYLDAPVATARRRTAGRDEAPDRIEQETQAFFERVREFFRERARQHARIVEIDASGPLADVTQSVLAEVGRLAAGLVAEAGP